LVAFAAILALAGRRAVHAWPRTQAPPTNWSLQPTPTSDRWLTWNPIPITAPVNGFWASGPNDVWAWGDNQVMRWNGRSWARVDVAIKQTIKGIWGAPNDVWLRAWDFTPRQGFGCVVDEAHLDTSLLHWDGSRWSSVESRSMHDDQQGNDEKWPPPSAYKLTPAVDPASVVGRDELADLWNRHGSASDMPAFKAGYRTAGGEVWAFSEKGHQVARFDGTGWTVGERLTTGNFSAVWMTGAADGWAVSRSPWPIGSDLNIGSHPRDGLFRWDGRAWRFVRPLPERTHALWASGPADVWAVGEHGLVMHWDGARWSERRLTGDLRSIWGRARDDVWVNGCADNFHHWNGSAWTHVRSPVSTGYAGVCPVLWGTSATDVSAFAMYHFLRWNGVAWRYEQIPFKDQVPLQFPARIAAAWTAPTSGDLYAVGSSSADGHPLVLRRSGGHWTREAVPPRVGGDLMAVWGDRDDDVWAVGTQGLILHWDGTAWRKEDSDVVEQLSSVHGAGGTVWIVGDRGTVLVRSL
jgi:hypothetical protein